MTIPIIEIAVESPLWADIAGIEDLIRRAVAATLAGADITVKSGAELSLLLCDDARMRVLNRDWRNIDSATNVLAFPAVAAEQLPDATIIGDIALAFETIDREARLENRLFVDHFSHLVVHGFLHLLGYDHGNGPEARTMEAMERRVLNEMNIADPYANPLETPVP